MLLKDHYKTLGVLPSANVAEIKKAFRGLAVRYHPDKNPDNSFAEAHFREVQEAYATLSHPARRRAYDEERWLSGMGNRMRDKQAITPSWILHECIRLRDHMTTIDTYRMSHGSLRDYILTILSDAHIGVLKQYNEKDTDSAIVMAILTSVKRLDIQYVDEIASRLCMLAGDDEQLKNTIQITMDGRRKEAGWDKVIPIVAVIITLFLCILMYLYGRRM